MSSRAFRMVAAERGQNLGTFTNSNEMIARNDRLASFVMNAWKSGSLPIRSHDTDKFCAAF